MLKYSDIKRYITPIYHTTIPLDFFEHWFKEQEELNLQLNPDFQRGHVWSIGQQIAYIEYILRGGKSGLDFYFNHPNWMGSW